MKSNYSYIANAIIASQIVAFIVLTGIMVTMDIKKSEKISAGNVRENSIGWMLKTLSTGLDKAMIQALKPHGLNLGQFAIIMVLLEGDGITQSEIGRKISMPGYSTTRNIDVLEKNGLLERRMNEFSRRSHCICLTGKGRFLAPQLFSIVDSVNDKVLLLLDETDKELFKKILIQLLPA